ncbi:hypothetical protein [Curtobacterium citreum]|uniref:Apea-like HEPN domain-containing protein n=1 Tax=Curtobacterium citreum TaxID=2036 RepID=A0ABU8YCZ1_9MICO
MTDEYDPRVWITSATGKRTPVRHDQLTGVDEFVQSISANTELPPEMRFEGWQGADEAHPADEGRPAYRVVYKTLRTVPTKPVAVLSSNCRVTFANGRVSWGEPRFGRAMPWRRADRHLVPDWGRLYYEPPRYLREEDNNVVMEGHEEKTPPMNYVEVIYVLDDKANNGTHYSKLDAARSATAPLLASLDLTFGPRLLGLRITEEIGEVFDDWHWNRRLDGPTVALEAQAELRYYDGDAALAQFGAIFDANAARSQEDRARLRIAAQWYWRADEETDPVQGYIAHWLTIESLEMNGTSIRPVKQIVHGLVGGDFTVVAEGIGRLQGLRGNLVHGNTSDVLPAQLEAVKSVAAALLERRLLGLISPARRQALQDAVFFASTPTFSR